MIFLGGYAAVARNRLDRPGRAVAFVAGLLVLWIALQTPLDPIGDRYLQSAHMLQHVLLGVVAPPLLLLGLSPALARGAMRLAPLRLLVRPIPAQAIAAAVMIFWHLPSAYDLTLREEGIHIFEHLTFIGAGVAFWWPVVQSTSSASDRPLAVGARALYILIGTLAQDGVALALLLSHAPFYLAYVVAPRLSPALDPVTDQTLAGAVLMLIGKTSYLVALLAIFARWAAGAYREEAASPA